MRIKSVSYTHLDVYKRQLKELSYVVRIYYADVQDDVITDMTNDEA